MPISLSVYEAAGAALVSFLVWRLLSRRERYAYLPGPPNASFLYGNFFQIFTTDAWDFHIYLKNSFGGVVKFFMNFREEHLYVSDPLALHHIVVKEQHIYEETEMFLTSFHAVLGDSLLSSIGAQHRRQRKMLNPVFSMKQMREIQPILSPVCAEFRDALIKQVKDGEKELNVMRWISRAALEFIGRGGLGHSFGSLDDEKATAHSAAVNHLGPLLFDTIIYRQFLPYLYNIGSPSLRRRLFQLMPIPIFREMTEVVDILDSESRKIYEEKKAALEKGDEGSKQLVGRGKDILSALLRENMNASESDRLPESEILGQINTFIFAGQDTTSHALARLIHQLALNQNVQDKLREEIIAARAAKNGDDFDYDELMALPYLDAVIRETLRVYCPVPYQSRIARQDTILPLAWPITAVDGYTQLTELPIKAGQNVHVAIWALNCNARIWGADADVWRPERWLEPLPASVGDAKVPGVYSSMMTFFGGGRACIGFKFSEMEMKMVLSTLVEKLVFKPGPEVKWEMSTITRPTYPASGSPATMLPLRVALYSY